MQYVNCQVYLSGDRNHSVPKRNVSIPEVVVLQYLHGADSVHSIRPTRTTKETDAEVLARIMSVYQTRAAEISSKLFPGAAPRLPHTLRDIGFDRVEKSASGSRKVRDSGVPKDDDDLFGEGAAVEAAAASD